MKVNQIQPSSRIESNDAVMTVHISKLNRPPHNVYFKMGRGRNSIRGAMRLVFASRTFPNESKSLGG